jgi:putative tricarboxylic transport membrane protein
MAEPRAGAGDVQTRWVEVAVALVFVLAGAVVIIDSLRVGIAWGDDGPKAGYFPFYIGWILALSGAFTAIQTLFHWKARAAQVFVRWDELKPVLTVLIPTIVYVGLIGLIGIYVASAIYIVMFMLWQGKFGILPALAVAVGVPVALFLLFEIWFLVPLPKGPLEHLLGY